MLVLEIDVISHEKKKILNYLSELILSLIIKQNFVNSFIILFPFSLSEQLGNSNIKRQEI